MDTYHPSFNGPSQHEPNRQAKKKSSSGVFGRVFKTRKSNKPSRDGDQIEGDMEADELDLEQLQRRQRQLQIPALSLTGAESLGIPSSSSAWQQTRRKRVASRRQLSQQQATRNYLADYNKTTELGEDRNEEADDDEDDEIDGGGWFFGGQLSPGLAVPIQPAYEHRASAARTQEPPMSSYEDWLDDRQGMNSGEQHELRTKGEQQSCQLGPRPSIDGSIISSLSGPSSRRSANKRDKKSLSLKAMSRSEQQAALANQKVGLPASASRRRGKSPSGGSRRYRQSSSGGGRVLGLLSLASRFKLTKKHEPIVKLQLTMLQSGLISLKKLDRNLQTFLPSGRMNSKELKEHVKLVRKYPVLATIEYKFASRYETYVCRHAQQEPNQEKNNYKKCIPYDYNRVVLRTIPGQAHSDYINASYVDSCLKPNAYIAAQGPNEKTLEDFWRMIWEQRSFVLVMLTKVFDFIKVMCNQYWPVEVNKSERYGNIEVTLLQEEPLADFVIRTIRLTYHRTSPNTTLNQLSEQQGQLLETNHIDDQDEGSDNDEDDDEEDIPEHEAQVVRVEEPLGGKSSKAHVRAPRFKAVRRQQQTQSPDESSEQVLEAHKDAEENATSPATRSRPAPIDTSNLQAPVDKNRPSELQLDTSNQLAPPPSPIRPDTPSSTSGGGFGVERNSSTRRAVKKRRRPQESTDARNSRPTQTKFQVPAESELVSDDSCDELDDPNHQHHPKERIVYQFHYHNWASHTCPFIGSLLHFRRRVRICADQMAKSGKTGPTVVHCNDGCGRTGAYLCIDANLELADEDGVYDVFNYTKKLRQSRKLLIENLDQYKFVYDTLEEAMFCGKTWFNVSEINQKLKHKSHRDATTKRNEYQLEYEKICKLTSRFSIGDCAGGHRIENREKNRDVSTVPPDNFRPYLTSFQTNDSTDYINAVFVDGYTRGKEYIVTEWPLHWTMSDFWSLVYDHDCNSVILLANPPESSTYPSFLPSEKELRRKFGPVFSAEMVSYTHYQNIKSWIYTINKKIMALSEVLSGVKSETKTTQVFQITCWPQTHRVPTSTNALVELMNMVERWRHRTTYGPVCVVSLDGKSRAGVYCAANVAIEQVIQHGEVDVFQAVKTVRRHRPQLIENMTEYKYCYDLILNYVLHHLPQPKSNG